ncbi:LPXTG cell wall anchor domain-containing protein [Streptococcus uberis]|uniref:LPXTG cell wall anchor domain-containing protein n=1 Tax=Streptococcus uberis TaxID=1349 RepID=UPI0027DDC10D|nr:LPXTG cell wall anchor domain-containing protein [Streptococcus uberis]MCK1239316.1 LPXTG cell wall anchor domain-containing protein [Streptococcus uberis]
MLLNQQRLHNHNQSHTQSTSTSQSQASEGPKASKTALPHTGAAENTGLYGSAALAILAALGLAGKKRNEND